MYCTVHNRDTLHVKLHYISKCMINIGAAVKSYWIKTKYGAENKGFV